MGEETEANIDEKPEKVTKFGLFCEKHGINQNLIMLKCSLFVMYGATSSLLPYLTIHMQSIGLTVEEIAIIYLALPFTTFLSPPITGFLVDKFGKYKPVVIMTLLLNAVFHHSLMFIPHQETPGVMPSAYVIRHPSNENIEVWWSPCPSRECPEEEELDLVVDYCMDHCLLLEQDPKIDGKAKPTNSPKHPLVDVGEKDDLNFKVSKRKGINGTSIKRTTTTTTTTEGYDDLHNEAAFFLLDMHPDLGEPIEQLGIEIEQDENDTSTDFRTRFGEKLLWDSGVNVTALEKEDLRCGGLVLNSNMTYKDRLSEWAKDCMVQKCRFRDGGPELCPPDYKESDDKVFWIYFVLRFLGTTMLTAAVTIMDPIALTMIQKYGGDFGRERLFSSVGMAIFSPVTGILIDQTSKGLGYTDYSAAFYTYDILLVISAITVFMMPLGTKLPADNIFRDLVNLLKMPHVILFILFLFALGNFWGFIESFLFLYLRELGAPNYLLGITVTVGTVSSLPFLYGAEKITKIFGHVNLIIVAFFSHSVRLVGYSFMENAWWCLPFEAMEALSCHLMWVAAATYCAILAPKKLLATLIGVLGMAHFSLGRGSGSFAGGLLIGSVGTREAFRYMGLMAVAGGISYGLLHLVWLRKIIIQNQIQAEDSDIVENGETEKLQGEPTHREQGTMVSAERLSLMIKYNQIGSLTSLPRGSKNDLDIYNTRSRRSSYNIEFMKPTRGSSASKVDLLKSALEINHSKHSSPTLDHNEVDSNVSLNRNSNSNISKLNKDLLNARAVSAPKLSQKITIAAPQLVNVVDDDGIREPILEEIDEHSEDKATTPTESSHNLSTQSKINGNNSSS